MNSGISIFQLDSSYVITSYIISCAIMTSLTKLIQTHISWLPPPPYCLAEQKYHPLMVGKPPWAKNKIKTLESEYLLPRPESRIKLERFLKKNWVSNTRRYRELENFFSNNPARSHWEFSPNCVDREFLRKIQKIVTVWNFLETVVKLSNFVKPFRTISKWNFSRGKIDNFCWTRGGTELCQHEIPPDLVNIGYCRKSPRCASTVYHLKTRKLWLTRNRISIHITRTDQISLSTLFDNCGCW